MHPEGFELELPARELPQTLALDRLCTGTGKEEITPVVFNPCTQKKSRYSVCVCVCVRVHTYTQYTYIHMYICESSTAAST